MKVSIKGLMLSLMACAVMLTGCNSNSEGMSSSANSLGSANQATSTQAVNKVSDHTNTIAKNEKSMIQNAFEVDVNNVLPETKQVSDGRTQNTYVVDDGKIVIEWTDSDIPVSMYYFRDADDTIEPETYSYPDTIQTDAKNFASDVLGVTVSDILGIYGYQNRIGVLMATEEGKCFHIQFMPQSSSVIGYQRFADQHAADVFYAEQKAEKLS